MALTSYANLKTAIAAFADVNASDISAVIDDAIRTAELRVYDEVRVAEMEVSLSYTISVSTVAVPARYLDLKYASYVDTSGREYPLDIKPAKWMREHYPRNSSTGRPVHIGREINTFIFKPTPDVATYVLQGVMYQAPVAISLSYTDNVISILRPEIFLYSSLVEIERTLKRPDQIPNWEAEYQRVKSALMMNDSQGNDSVVATDF